MRGMTGKPTADIHPRYRANSTKGNGGQYRGFSDFPRCYFYSGRFKASISKKNRNDYAYMDLNQIWCKICGNAYS
jgi:hypothetical protein